MTKLKIQRDDLIQALTIRCELMEGGWYLDIETGEVLLDSDAVDGMPDDLQENPRYRWIEPISSDESFRIMEQFVASLSDAKAAARLSRALDGPKPFRRFKDALLDFPARRKAYFKFQQAEHIRIAEAWCEENDIEVGGSPTRCHLKLREQLEESCCVSVYVRQKFTRLCPWQS